MQTPIAPQIITDRQKKALTTVCDAVYMAGENVGYKRFVITARKDILAELIDVMLGEFGSIITETTVDITGIDKDSTLLFKCYFKPNTLSDCDHFSFKVIGNYGSHWLLIGKIEMLATNSAAKPL
jgi:hypothetical protein